MSTVPAERVLVIPTQLLRDIGYFQGFMPDVEKYLEKLFDPSQASYRPRPEMENDPSFKQLIPYVIFRFTDSESNVFVFQYVRGTGQGEQRLHSKRSVGIGGHVSSDDAESEQPYAEGMRRELDEEVIIETDVEQRCVGLINDDETEVGQVHLGVVHLFDVAQPNVRPRESEIIEAGFRPISELMCDLGGFETWSSICLRALFS